MTLVATPAWTGTPDRFDGITIAANDGFALASLAMRRGTDDAFARAAAATFGFDLPEPGRAVTGDPWSAFWVAPDQWFVSAPLRTHEDIERRLRGAFGTSASLTEQTGAWVRFDIEGARAPRAMERLTMLDFAAMAPGDATRSTVHHLGVFVLRTDDGFSFLGPRSSARSLHHVLATAAKTVAGTVA